MLNRDRRGFNKFHHLMLFIWFWALSSNTSADEVVNLVKSTSGLPIALTKAIWSLSTREPLKDKSDKSEFLALADKISKNADDARMSANIVEAGMDATAAPFLYIAAVDPEPMTKVIVAGIGYAMTEAGGWLANEMIEGTKKNSENMIISHLRRHYGDEEIARITSGEELKGKWEDLNSGGNSLGDILGYDSISFKHVEMAKDDLISQATLQLILTSENSASNIIQIKESLDKQATNLDIYVKATDARLDKIADLYEDLGAATNLANKQLMNLNKSMDNLGMVLSQDWSNTQKRQAIASGLISISDPSEKEKTLEYLDSEIRKEKLISELRSVSSDISALTDIASNFGVDLEIIEAANILNAGVNVAATIASGNYLQGVALASGLFKSGGESTQSKYHKQIMAQFRLVNEKLDRVIELQVNTLKLLKIHTEQLSMIQSSLDEVIDLSSRIYDIVRAINIDEWDSCKIYFNEVLEGDYDREPVDILLENDFSPIYINYIFDCYSTLHKNLALWKQPKYWQGSYLDITHYGDGEGTGFWEDKAVELIRRRQYSEMFSDIGKYSSGYHDAFSRNNFMFANLRYMYVPGSTDEARQYVGAISSQYDGMPLHRSLANRKCENLAENNILSAGNATIICKSARSTPSMAAFKAMVTSSRINEEAEHILKLTTTIADFVDMTYTENNTLKMISKSVLQNGVANSTLPNELIKAAGERKGQDLLSLATALSDSYLIQQALLFGDYTAELIVGDIFPDDARSMLRLSVKGDKTVVEHGIHGDKYITSDVKQEESIKLALEILKNNSALALNALVISMNKSLSNRGVINERYYEFAIEQFRASKCNQTYASRSAIESIFPGWKFVYVDASIVERDKYCMPPSGGGHVDTIRRQDKGIVAVDMGDFYVPLPPFDFVSSKKYSYPRSVYAAIASRERVNQALLSRTWVNNLSDYPTTESNSYFLHFIDN